MTREECLELKIKLFKAYYDCRRNKRNTINAIEFELHFEDEVQKLYEEVVNMTYQPGRSVAFSNNYTRDCYVLKLDIQGFFMHISREILYQKVIKIVEERYFGADKDLLAYLFEQIIFQNPLRDCLMKGEWKEWENATDWLDNYNFITGSGREELDVKLTSYRGLMEHFKAYKLMKKSGLLR